MSWTYQQSTGNLTTPSGLRAGIGYSGSHIDFNKPEDQAVQGQGPIPQGVWTIGPFFNDLGGKGPLVCHLTPEPGTETYGRSGFMIHGDTAALNHTASEGCIILPHQVRQLIANSSDKTLEVIA